jgi:anti-anti-sigma regulatory factor
MAILTIELNDNCDTTVALELYQRLLQSYRDGMTVRLDAKDVSRILTPCIQLILSAMKSFDCAIINPTSAFVATFRELGLELSLLDDEVPEQDTKAYVVGALYRRDAA